MNEISSSDRSYIVQPPTLFIGLQPDDSLLEAETCSC